MVPTIHYAKTADGLSIAYWALGEGPPMLVDVGLWSHIQREWDIPERAAWFERAAQHHTLIRFDHRGSGLSDRNMASVTLDEYVLDLEAVVEHAGLEELALFAAGTVYSCPVTYAARHPDRVPHLILWHPTRLGGKAPPIIAALREIRDADWDFYTDAVVLYVQGWSSGEASARISAFFRDAITPDVARAIDKTVMSVDVTALLPKLEMPVLLMFRPGARVFSADLPRQVASLIPNARTAFLDGDTYAWYVPDSEKLMSTIESFVAETAAGAGAPAGGSRPQALVADVHVVLFTDIESSSALAQRLGDERAHQVRRVHDGIVRDALKATGGKEVKHTGDGIMAAFGMASAGLDCAIQIQRAIAAHVAEHPEPPLSVYVGLNAGEPIAENQDLFGTSVDLAARICDHADPDQILASDVVRQLVAGKHYLFADRGHSELRGMEDPVKLWEVRWQEDA